MRKRTALLPVVGAAAALSACGGGHGSNGLAGDTPSQILTAAVNALKAAHSVHVQGTVGSGAGALTIDADTFSNGDLAGTVGQNGASAQVVKIGSTDYIKGDANFWKVAGQTSATVAAQLAGRWVSTPDGQGSQGIGSTFTMSALAASLTTDNGTITKGSTGSVDGQPAVPITSSNGGTLWVATTGTPYPLEVTGSGSGSNGGAITFTGWDQGTPPVAPAGAVPAASIGTATGGASTTTTIAGTTGATGTIGTTGTTGGT